MSLAQRSVRLLLRGAGREKLVTLRLGSIATLRSEVCRRLELLGADVQGITSARAELEVSQRGSKEVCLSSARAFQVYLGVWHFDCLY